MWLVTDFELILAAPRGYCAGVDRAVETVERALELAGVEPVYVRKQIVHNAHVVAELERRGAVFVDSELDVPEGATVVFSAHGVAPSVHENANARGLAVVDATCPAGDEGAQRGAPVRAARLHDPADRPRGPRGGRGHDGRGAGRHRPGRSPPPRSTRSSSARTRPLAYVTQTTLSVDETRIVIDRLRERFPWIEAPAKDDICYATSNRQAAVKALAREVDLVLVIGSRNSSNSCRLVEVASEHGAPAYLIEDETAIDPAWLESRRRRASASPPAPRPRSAWCSASCSGSAPAARSR